MADRDLATGTLLFTAPQASMPKLLKHMPDTVDVLVESIAEQVAAKVKGFLVAASSRAVQPTLLNVKEAGVYLGRTEQAIQHLIFQKELPVVRIGRRVHLDRRDLDLWIEKNKY